MQTQQVNYMPYTTKINELMGRHGIKSMPQWWALPEWERAALKAYARMIAARYNRLYNPTGLTEYGNGA